MPVLQHNYEFTEQTKKMGKKEISKYLVKGKLQTSKRNKER
jgi:hypothetical protein